MDLFRMQCFISVGRHLNLTRAAEEMGITQPAMSVQMKSLEREVGLAVFDRKAGRLALTDAGKELLEGFAGIVSMYENVLNRAAAAGRSGKRRLIHIGYHGSITAFSLLFSGFSAAYGDVDETISVEEWADLANAVASGELDVAIVERHEAELRPQLRTTPLVNERFFCVGVSTGDPLSRRASIDVSELAGRRVVMNGHRSSSMDSMYRQLVSNGIPRENIHLVGGINSQISMAAAGMGIAPMPRFLAVEGNPDIVWVPVTGLSFSCELVLAWRPDNACPALGDFVAYCSQPEVVRAQVDRWLPGPEGAGEG